MFKKISVIVVDDSAFMRKAISDMINSQKDMEVIEVARNGIDAIEKAIRLSPDIITLDVEMPKLNGLEALKEIKRKTKSEVIMLSSLTAEGSETTMDCLKEGAFDFIQKPSGSISLDIDILVNELAEKIRYANRNIKRASNTIIRGNVKVQNTNNVVRASVQKGKMFNGDVKAIVIGASTGGPKVLFEILTSIPKSINIPIFVVQHMPKGFTKAFADRINKNSELNVVEARDGDRIEKNTIYIAPGGYHMTIKSKDQIALDLDPPIHGVRPAVDKLFESAAKVYKDTLVGCICTGMGKDGAIGIKSIKLLGGYTISQDEATSVVYGMPKAAYETGCVDSTLPYGKISEELIRLVRRK
ncbi:protein-glutamate methylesterase/protein-glutamine glutaminase [Clostridium cylindrosporum]|uniref:Protein-glutamate methylesterase/protein-glutamine glutaminase n=1 Tax=Clostridium cylindrosporum DSM 605 TaxID=1121307 RepID=A0A0J8D718_CLOCY|nr:chemotaxis response regulator protein-glutamate methylesterase [Clostridium cylindrosporum]KMT21677.1 chemotaxis response regulator protein-glutamate methylesterase CheB [Clostridium cylindrosporum DSM 605]